MNEANDRHDDLARLLRDFRVRAELTQSEVAAALGKPQSYVSKYESGERRLDLIELADLCPVLNVSLADLVREFEARR